MTKTLKCIGGPWDGRLATLESGYRYIIVRDFEPLPVIPNYPPSLVARYTETQYVIGIVVAPGASGNVTIEFLHPSDWSPEKTLRHALGAA